MHAAQIPYISKLFHIFMTKFWYIGNYGITLSHMWYLLNHIKNSKLLTFSYISPNGKTPESNNLALINTAHTRMSQFFSNFTYGP
jgi:hypothetical protein